jgi:lipopolysaccharide biosynthesis protein
VLWSYLKKVTRRLSILLSQLSQIPHDLSKQISIHYARSFEQSKIAVPLEVLVIVHAYWPQQFIFIINYLNRLKTPLWIVVTIPQGESAIQIEQLLPTISTHHEVSVMQVENAGRDIGPFLKAIETFANKNWDVVIKVHTKTSQNIWFETLVKSLLQSDRRIRNHARLLKSYPKGIIVHPLFRYPGHKQPLDEPAMQRLRSHLLFDELSIPGRWYFAAGSMFAASPAMLVDLKRASETIGLAQFEYENDYSQASLAHVFERFLGLYAFSRGSGLLCTSIFHYLDLKALLVKMI